MPLYFSLTTFRVLSLSLVIVSLPYTCIILYPLFVLGIIILGYTKAVKEEGFLVRGLRSTVTTGQYFWWNNNVIFSVDERFHVENIFQVYWLISNTILLTFGAINANLNTTEILVSEAVRWNINVFNGALVACLILGPLSYALFWFQRREELPEPREVNSQDTNDQSKEKRLFEQVLEDIRLGKRPNVNVIVRLANVVFLLLDYPNLIYTFWYMIHGDDPIWNALLILFGFLPGVAWHSHTNLVSSQNRLAWFLSSLFFPGFIIWTRVRLSFQHMMIFFSSVYGP